MYPIIKKYVEPHALHLNHGMNWPVYRYAEVLLFMAEALEEQGNSGEAATFLNEVRARAGLGNFTGDLEQAIFDERRVELAFENKRWFDLVRTGRAIDVITAYGNRIKANPLNYYYPEGTETTCQCIYQHQSLIRTSGIRILFKIQIFSTLGEL